LRRTIGLTVRIGLILGWSAVVSAALLWGWVQWHYGRQIWTAPHSVPEQPVAIVFGAGITPDGRLTPMLRDRVDAAIELYYAGGVQKILLSGDNRFVDYDEPGRMYDYALAKGVPPEVLVRDYAGRRTYDTCYRAKAIFGVEHATLVTQSFHLPRALFTCEGLGLEVIGLSADLQDYRSTSYYALRDGVALLRAWWDVVVARPEPVLGQPIDIGL
jgi:SanA protein